MFSIPVFINIILTSFEHSSDQNNEEQENQQYTICSTVHVMIVHYGNMYVLCIYNMYGM